MPDGMISPRPQPPIPNLERFGGMVDQRDVHRCDDQCVCPIHHTPLFYSPQFRKHACQDPDCVHAHGMRPRQPVMDEPGFESVRIMRLQPGDALVIEVDYPVDEKTKDLFIRRLGMVFPGHKAIVLDNGARLSVARPDGDHD